jgi:Chromosome segregation ATPases
MSTWGTRWVWLASLMLAVPALAYVSWVPPYAVLTQAYPMNATHFDTYINNSVVYIEQAGLTFNGSSAEEQAIMQYLYSQCKYVAVDVLNATQTDNGQLWLADVYCSSDGSMWLWLRWLPLRFAAYIGNVEFVNASNATAVTPVGTFTGYVPAGWYLDPVSKAVFKVPGANLTLLAYVDRLSAQIKALKAQLEGAGANASRAASLIAQLEAQTASLDAQRRALEEALRQRESELAALQANLRAVQAENSQLRAQLAQLKAENQALKARLASANETLASLNATYASQISALRAQLAAQLSGGQAGLETGSTPLMYVLLAALAGVVAALVVYRRRRAEE